MEISIDSSVDNCLNSNNKYVFSIQNKAGKYTLVAEEKGFLTFLKSLFGLANYDIRYIKYTVEDTNVKLVKHEVILYNDTHLPLTTECPKNTIIRAIEAAYQKYQSKQLKKSCFFC